MDAKGIKLTSINQKSGTLRKYVSPSEFSGYRRFLQKPPKSFFKRLVLNTSLRNALQSMSEIKAIPKGLKDQEVERGNLKRPPIPYIPVEDAVSDTVKTSKGKKDYKVKLPDGTKISHSLFDSGSNEAFMIHVQEVLSFCDRKQFFALYAEAEQALDAAKAKAESAQVKLDRALLN